MLKRRPNSSSRNAASVGTGIFLSRLAALGRESILGAYLGTRMGADAFGAALRIPKLMQNLLGEGFLSASFIPIYSQLLEEGDRKKARGAAGAVLGLLIIMVGCIVALTVFLARPLTLVLAPGFSGEKYELTITLLQIMAPGVGFIVLAAWCLGVLNSHRRFFLSYIAPAFWSAAIIAATAIAAIYNFTETDIARSAAWGVMIGGFLQFVIQLPQVIKVSGRIRLSFNFRLKAVRQVFTRFGPVVAGRGVVSLGSYLSLILASILATGAVAIMDRTQALYLLPISVFAVSIAAAELPEISREHKSVEKIYERLMKGAERVVFFLVFASVIFIAGGHTIVSAIYERVNFTSDDTLVVWLTLSAYSIGIAATGISRLIQNTAYGMGDVKSPAKIALIRMMFSVTLGLVLMLQFDRFGVLDGNFYRTGDVPAITTEGAYEIQGVQLRHLGAVGLGLGSMLAAFIELSLLRNLVRKLLGIRVSFSQHFLRLWPAALVAAVTAGILSISVSPLPGIAGLPIVILPSGLAYLIIAARRGNLQALGLMKPARVWLGKYIRR